jgi:hypothetical protein
MNVGLRLLCFALTLSGLLAVSWAIVGNWDFVCASSHPHAMFRQLAYSLHSAKVYGYMLEGPDLDPGAGLWWYFFAEMFAAFAPFFRFAFNFHALFHTAGVTVKFWYGAVAALA